MSYDVWLEIEPAPGRFETHLSLGNITSNVSRMWSLASPETDGLREIDGKRCSEFAHRLKAGVDDMRAHPEKYLPLNPENGWGDYEAALEYLSNIADAAYAHPMAIAGVDR